MGAIAHRRTPRAGIYRPAVARWRIFGWRVLQAGGGGAVARRGAAVARPGGRPRWLEPPVCVRVEPAPGGAGAVGARRPGWLEPPVSVSGTPGGAGAVRAGRPRCPGGRGGGPPAFTRGERLRAPGHKVHNAAKPTSIVRAGNISTSRALIQPRPRAGDALWRLLHHRGAPQALENAANHADLPPHRPHMQVDDAYVVRRPAPPAICCVCQVAAPLETSRCRLSERGVSDRAASPPRQRASDVPPGALAPGPVRKAGRIADARPGPQGGADRQHPTRPARRVKLPAQRASDGTRLLEPGCPHAATPPRMRMPAPSGLSAYAYVRPEARAHVNGRGCPTDLEPLHCPRQPIAAAAQVQRRRATYAAVRGRGP